MTDNERQLLLLVADALLMADTRQMLDRDLRLRLRDARHAMDDEAHAAPRDYSAVLAESIRVAHLTSEPAAVLQALVERINPTTPAEAARDLVETLAGLVSQACRRELDFTSDLASALRDAQVPIYEAMQGVPRAAPRSATQGGQRLPRSSGSGEAPHAASDAHSPGTGNVREADHYAKEKLRRGLPNYDMGGADGLPLRPGAGKRWACPRCGHDLEASIALVGEAWKG